MGLKCFLPFGSSKRTAGMGGELFMRFLDGDFERPFFSSFIRDRSFLKAPDRQKLNRAGCASNQPPMQSRYRTVIRRLLPLPLHVLAPEMQTPPHRERRLHFRRFPARPVISFAAAQPALPASPEGAAWTGTPPLALPPAAATGTACPGRARPARAAAGSSSSPTWSASPPQSR